MKIFASNHTSPIGEILLLASETGLMGVYFQDQLHFPRIDPEWIREDEPLSGTKRMLEAYFAGKALFASPPLHLQGTPFQQRVWKELRNIPAGRTCSYGDIARRIGSPAAVRAVGAAIGRNPISILVPCHRVVGSTGDLTGYAGGIGRKSWLLEHEAKSGGAFQLQPT